MRTGSTPRKDSRRVLIHPHTRNNLAPRCASKRRVASLWRALFSLPPKNAIALAVLAGALVFLSGCAVGSFELTRPDGVTVRASALALFRDTGLEGFTYTVDESSRGDGLLPATESRNATVGAKGYRGSTNIDAVIKLLEAVK